eukprot:7823973-Lingulodinium_polyedra.AAC.1
MEIFKLQEAGVDHRSPEALPLWAVVGPSLSSRHRWPQSGEAQWPTGPYQAATTSPPGLQPPSRLLLSEQPGAQASGLQPWPGFWGPSPQ